MFGTYLNFDPFRINTVITYLPLPWLLKTLERSEEQGREIVASSPKIPELYKLLTENIAQSQKQLQTLETNAMETIFLTIP